MRRNCLWNRAWNKARVHSLTDWSLATHLSPLFGDGPPRAVLFCARTIAPDELKALGVAATTLWSEGAPTMQKILGLAAAVFMTMGATARAEPFTLTSTAFSDGGVMAKKYAGFHPDRQPPCG